MKLLTFVLMLSLYGCATSYTSQLPPTPRSAASPYVEQEDEYSASIAPRQLGVQNSLGSSSGSLLTTAIMGVNLYRNISALNSDMIKSELNARADAMVANPSELYNSLYP